MANPSLKSPLVKLFYLNGREVLLREQNICFQGLVQFVYKYSEKDDDSCKLTLQFNNPDDARSPLFKPGRFYLVKWGYKYNMSPARALAINKVKFLHNQQGYTVTLEMIPLASYKDKNKGWASMQEAMADGIKLKAEWWDIQGTKITVDVTAKDGELYAETDLQQEIYTAKPIAPEERWKRSLPNRASVTLAQSQGVHGPILGWGGPLGAEKTPRTLAEVVAEVLGLELDDVYDALLASLTRMIARRVKGYFTDVRDDSVTIKTADTGSISLFTLKFNSRYLKSRYGKNHAGSPGLLSCSVIQDPKAAQGLRGITTAVNPDDKSIATEESTITDELAGRDVIARYKNANDFLVYEILGKLRPPEKNPDTGELEYHLEYSDGSISDKLSAELVEKYKIQVGKLKQKTAKQIYREHFVPNSNPQNKHREYSGQAFVFGSDPGPAPIDGIPKPRTDFNDIVTEYPRANYKDKSGQDARYDHELWEYKTFGWSGSDKAAVTAGNLKERTRITFSPFSFEEAKNAILGMELDAYFNQLIGHVVVEGIPVLEIGFNFNLIGIGDLEDGKFHCGECTHAITGRKYTTTIKGGKIPKAHTRWSKSKFQYIDEVATVESLEPFYAKAAEEINCVMTDPDWLDLMQGNEKAVELATYLPEQYTLETTGDTLTRDVTGSSNNPRFNSSLPQNE